MTSASGQSALPEAFGALEVYVSDWALPTEAERAQRRLATSESAAREFYERMLEYADDALGYLGNKPIDQLDEPDQNLLLLLLSLANIAMTIECYGTVLGPNSLALDRHPPIRIQHMEVVF